MKLSALTALFAAGLPVLALDYSLSCVRAMDSATGGDPQAYFNKVFDYVCTKAAKCRESMTPTLGDRAVWVNGGCLGCPVGLNPNLYGDCLLSPIR
ncbi:hypothetical protein E4U41_006399 [Claviceps citrina]|nr:hypothetical protein E4U41_006399 [Claviceps citrina]